MAFCPEHPKCDQNPKFTLLRRRASHPFHMGVSPGVETDRALGRVQNDDGGRDQYTSVLSLKKKRASNAKGAKKIHNHCVIFVICLLCTKVNRSRMCMFSFNRVKLQSFTSSLAWLFWERSAFLSASYSSSWSCNRDIQALILGKLILNFAEC